MVMEPTIRIHKQTPLERLPTVIVRCCREWPVAVTGHPGGSWGRCGICGERPVYEREDDGTPLDTGSSVV